MANKNKLQKILNKLTGTDSMELEAFKTFDQEVQKLKENLHQTIKVSTLDDVNNKISKFKEQMDFGPLMSAFEQLKTELNQRDDLRDEDLRTELDTKVSEINQALSSNKNSTQNVINGILEEGLSLQSQIAEVAGRKMPDPVDFTPQIKDTENRLMAVIATVESNIKTGDKTEELRGLINALEESLKKLRVEALNRGGGSMNRQIFIGGSNPLTRYTDINLKAGSNVTITYVNNDQTKKVDITIAATGGGGGGTVRSISSVSTNTAAGSTSGTDYVYLCTGTITITLPTAAGNTNLYTVKNVGTGVVTIATSSAQTIDGNTSIQMATRFTSVDLISDTNNWNIT